MRLTTNFTLEEMIRSETALRKGIKNKPSKKIIYSLLVLCKHVLQPIRSYEAKPVYISSGFRCKKLNIAIGGSTRSQHCKGEAVDITMNGLDNFELVRLIEDTCSFDQLILEFYNEDVPEEGWVHVSYKQGKNREQVLQANKINGKTVYSTLELF